MNELSAKVGIDETDRRLIVATQDGLPLCPRPYHVLAEALGLAPDEVMARFRRMLETGVIRRLGAVPNHYRIGYGANGMSVFDCRLDGDGVYAEAKLNVLLPVNSAAFLAEKGL